MGVQIHIDRQDMINAGWEPKERKEMIWSRDENGEEIESSFTILSFKKGDWEFDSYAPSDFCWDCKASGSNRVKFKEAGLFDLPHILS